MSACSRRSYPRHSHDTFGIGLIDSGGQSWWSGCGRVEAGPGIVISQNPGEVHDGSPVGYRSRSWRMLYLDPAMVQAVVTDLFEGRDTGFEFASPAFADAMMAMRFNRTFQLLQKARSTLRAETAITALFSLAVRHSRHRPPRVTPLPGIDHAREMIDSQPAESWTLAQLSQASSLTRYQLIRGFARHLGTTPHAYIVQRRLEVARRLLRVGRPISETALSAGFYDQAHLTRHFTRQFGVPPGVYARR